MLSSSIVTVTMRGQGPNRDEPPRPGLQPQANDHDLRGGTADGGDQNLIASLKPRAVDQRARPTPRQENTARPLPRLAQFSTPSASPSLPSADAGTLRRPPASPK